MQAFVDEFGLSFPQAVTEDGSLWSRFGVAYQPAWVFVDRSKAGTRRWCDMNACGNRANAHRHYARSRKA